ncbi:MAG: caspase family protein [Myxococcales bacterium]|nr:caspase family protein [Myxococcales bacterium]
MSAAARIVAAVLLGLLAFSAASARTVVITIGNDRGLAGDLPLRYAARDATRFGEVMRRLGAVAATDLIELQGEDADAVRQTLHQINVRVRQGDAADTALVVYYSGHADAEGLHMAGTTLAYAELRDLITGSPAGVRVLVLDGCRSGGLTRVKGARATEETFDLTLDDRIEVEGLAIMTSSAAHEDSHESEHLKGSFFTHHLLAALWGAGDEDGDARVTLSEAYAYAARRTLASSGRTRQLQHPTYAYDIKGRGDFVMTRLDHARGIGRLELPAATTWLVRHGGEDGPLQAEVTPERPGTLLSVPAGEYFVQGRYDDHYDEYAVDVPAGQTARLSDRTPRRVAYARLVRKGGGGYSQALQTMGAVHSPVLDGHGITPGASLGYTLTLPWGSVGLRARFGQSSAQSGVDGVLRTYALGVAAERVVDLRWLSAGLGVLVEGAWRQQTLDDPRAPSPSSWGLGLGILGSLEAPLAERWYARLEGGPLTQIVQVSRIDNGARDGTRVETRLGGFGGLGLGVRF